MWKLHDRSFCWGEKGAARAGASRCLSIRPFSWVPWAFWQHGELRDIGLVIDAGFREAGVPMPKTTWTQKSNDFISSIFYQVKSEDCPRFRGGKQIPPLEGCQAGTDYINSFKYTF